MRGRKPKPTLLKIAEGNRGQHANRINRDEPELKAGVDAAPTWIEKEAKAIYRELAAELGYLRSVDSEYLAMFAQNAARLHMLERRSAKERHMNRNTLVAIEKMQSLQIKIGSELGLGPAQRSRIIDPRAKPKDELSSFVKSKSEGRADGRRFVDRLQRL